MTQTKSRLVEWQPIRYDAKLITEARQAGQPVIVPALLQRADTPNSNGRIYPRHVLERECKQYQQLIDENRALGELDHPASDPVVNLQNASIAVKEMHWEGNDLKGQIEILHKVPAGNLLVGLMEHGINIGISSRGVGSTIQTESGHELVDDDYTLLCFDAVSIGSVEGAGFLKEHKKINLNENFSMDKYMKFNERGKIIGLIDEKFSARSGMKDSKYKSLQSIVNDIMGDK